MFETLLHYAATGAHDVDAIMALHTEDTARYHYTAAANQSAGRRPGRSPKVFEEY